MSDSNEEYDERQEGFNHERRCYKEMTKDIDSILRCELGIFKPSALEAIIDKVVKRVKEG